VAEAETRRPDSFDVRTRQVRYVDVQDGIGRQRIGKIALDDAAHEVGGGAEVAAVGEHERHGDRRDAEETALHRGRHGAGVQHVVAEVRAVIDPGDQHVGRLLEQTGDRDVHAIRRRTVHVVHVVLGALDAQRRIERQRVARAAAVAVRRDDRDLREIGEMLRERPQAGREIAIVVGKEDPHCC
jgi:hypothetical protein